MAIGSTILYVEPTTGKVKEIYNHMSAHLMYTGRVLHDFYKTKEQVSELVENGDLYCIGYSTNQVPDDKLNDEVYRNGNKHCTFYIRDRNDKSQKRKTREHDDLNHAIETLDKNPQQFTYIWKDGKWYYRLWRRRVEEMNNLRIYHDDEEDG